MSVTMHLYKVVPNVKYVGYYLDFVPKSAFEMGEDGLYNLEKYEKELGAPMREDGHWPDIVDGEELWQAHKDWEEKQHSQAWSDGVNHDKINITHYNSCFKKYRGWGRYAKRLNTMPIQTFSNGKQSHRYIAVDEVQYAQGWFFKKAFFSKEITHSFCVTKEQMENFFKQYIDFNSHDDRGREAVDRFLNSWEDGMIFECAW